MFKACSKGLSVSVSVEDVQFLKEEYKQAKREVFELHMKKNKTSDDRRIHILQRGTARGLEMALIRLGVNNDECERLSREAY